MTFTKPTSALPCLVSVTLLGEESTAARKSKVTQLMSKDLPNLPGKDAAMIAVDYPPGSSDLYIATMEMRLSTDRIELLCEDAPATTIRATVGRLLTDRDEGVGSEIEDYTACWIEITVDEPSDIERQTGCIAWHGFAVSAKRPPGNSSQEAELLSSVVGNTPALTSCRRCAAGRPERFELTKLLAAVVTWAATGEASVKRFGKKSQALRSRPAEVISSSCHYRSWQPHGMLEAVSNGQH